MSPPRYPGESWQTSLVRADIEAAEHRAETERAARHAAAPEPPPSGRADTSPRTPQPRRTWRDLSPSELNRY